MFIKRVFELEKLQRKDLKIIKEVKRTFFLEIRNLTCLVLQTERQEISLSA